MAIEYFTIKNKLASIKHFIKTNSDTVIGLAVLGTLVGSFCYYIRSQELTNVTVTSFDRDYGHCGEYGEVDCYNPVYQFKSVDDCFEDKSLSGCYDFKTADLLLLKEGEQVNTVAYRNPILPPWGCKVITELDPSKEEHLGKPSLSDRILCLFR